MVALPTLVGRFFFVLTFIWSYATAQEVAVTVNSIGMKLRYLESGKFQMGSKDSVEALQKLFPYEDKERFNDALTQHPVVLSRPFYIGQFEVTVDQFRTFVMDAGYRTEAEKDGKENMGLDAQGFLLGADFNWRNPGFPQDGNHPVVHVSWNDANAFCQWLSKKEGKHYRLPTEAEWEYACRAGTNTRYSFGDDPEKLSEVANVLDGTASIKYPDWINGIGGQDGYVTTAPVGSYAANLWGLYDMHGNVREWCQDFYGPYADRSVEDPTGPVAGRHRVIRGGGWFGRASSCRSASRIVNLPENRTIFLGFRVALDPESRSGK